MLGRWADPSRLMFYSGLYLMKPIHRLKLKAQYHRQGEMIFEIHVLEQKCDFSWIHPVSRI
jgi:hypothetical protein